MKQECKNFQSRTYPSGEVARFCVLDLAPEAPWRCPENCEGYERRLADVAWVHGSLIPPPVESPPQTLGEEDTQRLLRDAEEIVNIESTKLPKKSREGVFGLFRRRGK